MADGSRHLAVKRTKYLNCRKCRFNGEMKFGEGASSMN